MNALEKLMTEGELAVTGRLVDASNATLFGTIVSGDEEVRVIYKPIAGERPLWDFADGNLAQREYAAYLVSEFGGWNLVPLTILREGPFGAGMVQQWIDIDETIDLSLYYRENNASLREMALFDAVVNNTDRKIGHLIPTVEGKLFGCDHGVTFHEEDKLRTVLWQWSSQPLSNEENNRLKNLLWIIKSEEKLLTGLISEKEFKALIGRVERLLTEGTFPEPSDQWPAVPWPPF
ncbi:hypothetical protein MCEMRE26_00708 [Candidatus Nanopelagicaceae bacterium]